MSASNPTTDKLKQAQGEKEPPRHCPYCSKPAWLQYIFCSPDGKEITVAQACTDHEPLILPQFATLPDQVDDEDDFNGVDRAYIPTCMVCQQQNVALVKLERVDLLAHKKLSNGQTYYCLKHIWELVKHFQEWRPQSNLTEPPSSLASERKAEEDEDKQKENATHPLSSTS